MNVVLRSSATMVLGYERVKSMAPAWLQARISGATDEVVRWLTLYEARKVNTNFGVVRRYVEKHGLRHWVTLDDSDDGWPDAPDVRKHLVQTDCSTGLSDPMICKRLNLAFAECEP